MSGNCLAVEKHIKWCFLLLALLVPFCNAQAEGVAILYAFCSQAGCTDGSYPSDGLITDKAGNLYGTTESDGRGVVGGTVFKLTPGGTETVLYRFCSMPYCRDGENPVHGVIADSSGNFFGVTESGGGIDGTVFKLAPDGTETVLYSFCVQPDCTDGDYPGSGLIMDGTGNLYGVTQFGGDNSYCPFGCGIVFRVAQDGTETVLHAFCTQTGCTDGIFPSSGLLMDSTGNLYGVTEYGGDLKSCNGQGCGIVFKLAPDGTETVLYNFCSQAQCADGEFPSGTLTLDSTGNLYGTTSQGGSGCAKYGSCGTVFKLAPDGTETVLHAFTGLPDGAFPESGVIQDKNGNLFGTTLSGGKGGNGPSGRGIIFRIAPDGTERVLHRFTGRTDGARPSGRLMLGSAHRLYGTTVGGGNINCSEVTEGCGTVYALKH